MSPMKSILWKEVRQQGVIMVAMLGLAVMVLGLAVWGLNLNSGTADKSNNLNFVMFVAVSMTALYAVASAATTYAAEREERTLGVLETLPLLSRQLWYGKVGVAGGLALLFLALMVIATILIGRLNPVVVGLPDSVSLVDFSRVLAVVEYFLWALLFSLLLSRPLVAATLGIVVPPLVTVVCAMFTRTMQGFDLGGFTSTGGGVRSVFDQMTDAVVNGSVFSTNPLLLGIRGVIIVGLAIATTRLAWGWLDRGSDRHVIVGTGGRWKFAAAIPWRIASFPFRFAALQLPAFGRLFWLTLRTQWPLMLCWSLIPFALLFPLLMWIRQTEITMAFLVAMGGVAGAFSFSPDKVANGQAFLGQCAERPGLYFLANMLVWVVFIALASAGVVLVLLCVAGAFSGELIPANAIWSNLSNRQPEHADREIAVLATISSVAALLCFGQIFCFSVGQFCSMMIRSRIIAFVIASAVAAPFAVWYLLILASRTPFWYGVLPIMLAFLCAGWLATRWWMGGGVGMKRGLTLVTGLALFLATLGWSITAWRRYEIPAVANWVDDYRTSSDRSADLLRLGEARARIAETIPGPVTVTDMDLSPKLSDFVSDLEYELKVAFGMKTGPVATGSATEIPGSFRSDFEIWLEDQSAKIQAFRGALDLGVACLPEIELMEPDFEEKIFSSRESRPILPHSIAEIEHLLCYEFLRAVRQKEELEIWPALKAILSLNMIYDRTWGTDHAGLYFSFEISSYVEIWMRSGLLNPEHVDEAASFIHDHLPNHSFMVKRGLERDYLQIRQAIVTNNWISERDTRMQKQMLLAAFGFEKERSLRLLDAWTINQLWNCCVPEIKALGSNPYSREYKELIAKFDERALDGRELTRLASNTIVPAIDNETIRTLFLRNDPNHRLRRWDRIEMSNRRTELAMLSLAAVSFQFKHGRMPESLVELVGDNMPRLPKSRYAPVKEGLEEFASDFVLDLVWDGGEQVHAVRERSQKYRDILCATIPVVSASGD